MTPRRTKSAPEPFQEKAKKLGLKLWNIRIQNVRAAVLVLLAGSCALVGRQCSHNHRTDEIMALSAQLQEAQEMRIRELLNNEGKVDALHEKIVSGQDKHEKVLIDVYERNAHLARQIDGLAQGSLTDKAHFLETENERLRLVISSLQKSLKTQSGAPLEKSSETQEPKTPEIEVKEEKNDDETPNAEMMSTDEDKE